MKNCRIIHLFIIAVVLFFSCDSNTKSVQSKHAEEAKLIAENTKDIDSLLDYADKYASMNERRAEIIMREKLGKLYRDRSDFNNAIIQHDSAITLAIAINDTLHWIRSLNQQGTNFRRLSDMDEASKLHCRALELCDTLCNDTSYEIRKDRVVSLNGLGNTLMSLGNYEAAEEIFRRALAGEQSLGSALGQAINYANIGSIFEKCNRIDSARYYYNLSMEKNKEIDDKTGIGLCYQYLGKLDEQQGDMTSAMKNYLTSYEVLVPTNDSWHWLEASIALAELHILTNNADSAKKYIDITQKEAEGIKSKEHIYKACKLCSQYEEKWGSPQKALFFFKKSEEIHDSIHNEKRYNQLQNLRVNYEAKRHNILVEQAKQEAKYEQTIRYVITTCGIVAILVMGAFLAQLSYTNRVREKSNKALKEANETMKKASEELHKADEELRQADNEIRNAYLERQNFYRDIAHRFRTPLTVVIGMTQQLREHISKDDEQAQGDFLAVERQNGELLRLVNEMMHKLQPNASTATVTSVGGNIRVNHFSADYTEDEGTMEAEPVAIANVDGTRPLILLAEDNEDVARYQCELLERNGYRVNWASDGVMALELIKEEMPKLIITDVMMPNMDGLELCRRIRSDESTSHLPLIIVTARVEDRDRMKGLEAGAEVYLTKPFLGRELLLNMKNLLEQREKLRGKGSETPKDEPEKEEQKTESVAKFVKMLNEVIDANISDPDFTSTTLAAHMCLSRAQLNRRVNTELGTDTTHYIRERRLERACRLLKHPDMSIMDVQVACGFESPAYFSRVFKQRFDKSPTEYRKEK